MQTFISSCETQGKLSVLILDRDGFIARTLVKGKQFSAGAHHLSWNGRDDQDIVVPDEAWSLKIDLTSNGKVESYFPANVAVDHKGIAPDYYHRENGIIAYTLAVPSRVHIQAGSAVEDPKTKEPYGPVMKTVRNREPKVSGPVTEFWDGFDESGTIYVSDLPNFKMAIAAAPLPENSLITTGNRSETFIDRIARGRNGGSQFTFRVTNKHHHMGLSALDDVSPPLEIKPLNASFIGTERLWMTKDDFIEFTGAVLGIAAKNFAQQPGKIEVYLDYQRVTEAKPAGTDFHFKVPLKPNDSGSHIVSVNWASDYGPTAVNNFKLLVKDAAETAGNRKGKKQ